MSEGILLDPTPRGILLPEAVRIARLEIALPQIRAALEGEPDPVAVQATLACLFWETFVQCNWCGFYRVTAPHTLTVGPYQGGMGCLRISFDRGVCGAAASTLQTQLVPDVRTFSGHIACDDATRSELVTPLIAQGELKGVLDLDSAHLNGFCVREAQLLKGFLRERWLQTLNW